MTDAASPRIVRLCDVLANRVGRPSDGSSLAELNASLRAGQVRLDCTGVRAVGDETLRELLSGLDLVRDEDVLGVETVPETLENRILNCLDEQRAAPAPRRRRQGGATQATGSRPGVWSAGGPTDKSSELATEDGAPEVNGDGQLMGTATPSTGEAGSSILTSVSQVQIRDELERLVMADLLGPAGGPEEIVDESSVRDRYLVGMLAPRRSHGDPAQDDDLAIEEGGAPEEGGAEAEVSGPDWMFPSAFGMTFAVDGAVEVLRVSASWGMYERVARDEREQAASAAAVHANASEAAGGESAAASLLEEAKSARRCSLVRNQAARRAASSMASRAASS